MERIREYIEVEPEAATKIEETQPAPNWPAEGSVQFSDYSTSYREDLPPVLKNVSFSIKPKEKVGIVGRTGAGKSSLALAMFRALEAHEGNIFIDDIDIGTIGLHDLRLALTIVPQDPTLFKGTIRSNIDPFTQFTDEDIFAALRRVHLIGMSIPAFSQHLTGTSTPTVVTALEGSETGSATPQESESVGGSSTAAASFNPDGSGIAARINKNIFVNLSSPVTESGNNLSQGQKQLLCLARAILKVPKVLIMDEATASIDYATDSKVQQTIRELNCTIITIAHRLQTIIDYDKILVLDKGEVVEFDHPWTLIQKQTGMFRDMCEQSGDIDILRKAAEKAWHTSSQ
jgi:ABC-type multidrug transport system fused ATPase/permease subunit